MPRQRIGGRDPDGLERLALVGHRRLPGGHARDEKARIKALGKIAIGDPVAQPPDLVHGKPVATLLDLHEKIAGGAIQTHYVTAVGNCAVGPIREKDAQFLEGFANCGDRKRALLLRL